MIAVDHAQGGRRAAVAQELHKVVEAHRAVEDRRKNVLVANLPVAMIAVDASRHLESRGRVVLRMEKMMGVVLKAVSQWRRASH